MVGLRFGIIIPARYGSTRLPGKMLLDLAGKTLIQRVVENAKKIEGAVFVAVATDDERIVENVKDYCTAILTDINHVSGTDRIIECYEKLCVEVDVLINLQGDEPFLKADSIYTLLKLFANPNCQIGTLCYPIASEIDNENKVKLVKSVSGKALYFSRSRIPYNRNAFNAYLGHIGVYAFRTDVLGKIKHLSTSALEMAESLEQLKWLANDLEIYVNEVNEQVVGIDTAEDLKLARAKFES